MSSDNDYDDDDQEFNVERPVEKKTKKQKRTPAQLEALRQARLTRSLKAKQRRETPEEEPINLTYLAGIALLSAGGLGVYYYVNLQKKQQELQTNLPETVPVKEPPQIIQKIMQPIHQLEDIVAREVAKVKEQLQPTIVEVPVEVPTPEPEPEPEQEPLIDNRMNDFLKGAREL